GHHRAAPHAAAHDMRAFDPEVIEQAFALRDVMRPGDALDAAAGLAAFAPVEQDAGVALRQMIEQLDPGIDALRAPRVYRRVETARRVHQERRAGARHLVARGDTVDDRGGHHRAAGLAGALAAAAAAAEAAGAPLIWRPARTSSA